MSYSDSNNEKSYSWINIVLILLCVLILIYGVIYFKSPETHYKMMQYLGLQDNLTTQQNEVIAQEANDADKSLMAVDKLASDASTSEALLSKEASSETIEKDSTLPPLNNSDPFVVNQIDEMGSADTINSKIIPSFLIHNSVVFIANFSNGELLTHFSPLAPPTSAFTVEKEDGQLYMSTLTYQRYNDYSDFISSLNTTKTVLTYKKLKPLIDESYAEISQPGKQFEQVLNQAINLVLSVPIIEEKIKLNSPSVMYTFDDKKLQALSDSQKFLLRFGPENLAKIQIKLADIQTQLNKPESDVTADEI